MQRLERLVAVYLSLAMLASCIMLSGGSQASITSLELVPGKYTGSNTYVPGEAMSIVVVGNLEGEEFIIYSVIGTEAVIPGGNIVMPASGSVKVTYDIPNAPDGEYLIRAKRKNGATEAEAPFRVQGYAFKIETDRKAYLSGDEMRVFWTANNLKDQTLPSAGVGKIEIWSQDADTPGEASKILDTHRFNISAGSVSFKLPPIVNYSLQYFVDGWFNSSSTSPLRFQYSREDFSIKRLGVIIATDKDQYTAGSLMRLTVRTYATDNPANPSGQDIAEPECNVTISIKKLGSIQPVYAPFTLKTDSQGTLKHIIALTHADYVDGAEFEVEIYGYKGTNSISDSLTFEIVSSSSISIVLDFNRGQYASGERLFVNATASAIGDATGTSFTYLLEIRANSANGSLFARSTQTNGNFSFTIPANFEGLLWAKVTVDDGAGNSASVVQQVSVAYAIILVNAGIDYYNPNDLIEVKYDIVGAMDEAETFYIVYDSEGNVVDEGVTDNGLFIFQVPVAPSGSYQFTVFASAGGRVVQGTDTLFLFSGYLLVLDFNRDYYGPGDIMAVDYTIIALGTSNMPASFLIIYGLVNGPRASLQTSRPSGTLIYNVPEDIHQGDQPFTATCNLGSTQVSTTEVMVVKADANPLWQLRISDIPVFSIIVLLISILALYIAYKTRKGLKAMESDGGFRKPGQDGAIARRTQEAYDSNSVSCVECGNPIEITTTRRPIEVMCPHCGEIQHVE